MKTSLENAIARAVAMMGDQIRANIDELVIHTLTFKTMKDLLEGYRNKTVGTLTVAKILGEYTKIPLKDVGTQTVFTILGESIQIPLAEISAKLDPTSVVTLIMCRETRQAWCNIRNKTDIMPLPLPTMTFQSNAPGCWECGADTAPARCAQCKMAKYCGEACQKKHWKAHKPDCERLKNMMA
jgi:MoaA/NifB/PqqE/SkfB family radical SAM enzyme